MCFDLGWTFVRSRIPRKGTDCFKFLLYSVVAWGVPLVLLTLVGLVDFNIIGDSGGVKPDIGNGSCFLTIEGLQR